MKIFAEVTVPERTVQREVNIQCDLCGRQGRDGDWVVTHCNDVEVMIKYSAGNNYGGDGGDSVVTEVDMCPECWNTKLLPWLASLGVTPTPRKVDW